MNFREIILKGIPIIWVTLFYFSTKAQNTILKNFDVKDGLPSSEVYSTLKDKNGFLWFTTNGGIARFNGVNFKVFNSSNGLPDNTVFQLIEDRQQRMWVRTFSGKLAYIFNDSIHALPCNDALKKKLGQSLIYSIYIDRQNIIWLGLGNNSKYFSIKPPYSKTSDIYEHEVSLGGVRIIEIDDSGYVVGTNSNYINDSLYFLNPENKITGLSYPNTFRGKTAEARAHKISRENYVLAVDNNVFLIRKNEIIEHHQIPEYIVGLHPLSEGNFLISAYRGGAYLYEPKKNKIQKFEYLKDKTITDIEYDNEDGLWLTTLEGGVYYAPEEKIRVFGNNGNNSSIDFACIAASSEILLAGTQRGELFTINRDGSMETFELELPGESNNNYFFLEPVDQNRFFAGNNIPHVIKNNNSKISFSLAGDYNKNKVHNLKKGIHIPHQSAFIGISPSYVFILNNKDFSELRSFRCNQRIFSLEARDTNIIYLGTDNGVLILKNGNIKSIVNKLNSRVTDIKFLGEGFVFSTGGNGIYFKTEDTLINFTESSGLCSDIVKCIWVDLQNRIWIGTNKGMQCVELANNKFKSLKIFKRRDGLPSDEIRDVFSLGDTLLAATREGLFKMPVSLINRVEQEPVIIIRKATTNKTTLEIGSENILEYGHNAFEFHFESPIYKNEGFIEFRYRLSGLDSNWIITKNGIAGFNFIPPGRYSLEVQVRSSENKWFGANSQMELTLLKPFWETWWFRSFYILVIISLSLFVAQLFYSRKLRILEKKALLEKRIAGIELKALRAQMNPHFIFNAINSIQTYILRNDSVNAHRYLGRFAKLMRNILEQTMHENIIIEQEIETLLIYLELEKLRFNFDFDLHVEIDEGIRNSQHKIPSMLIQPYFENAIWHGLMHKDGRKMLLLKMTFIEIGKIICTIEDNGIGRKRSSEINNLKSSRHKSLGMEITGERLDILKKQSDINIPVEIIDLINPDGSGAGTRVELIIPYV